MVLPRLNREDIEQFKISNAGLLQEIDQISLENDNKEKIALNPQVEVEIAEAKKKLMLIH